MVSNWEEEKRPAKNHLAENSDERPGRIGSKAQDKVEWRRLIAALCSSQDEKDEWVSEWVRRLSYQRV